MRKTSEAHRRVLLYRVRRRPARAQARKAALRQRRQAFGGVSLPEPLLGDAVTIRPPAIFSLSENYDEVVEFVVGLATMSRQPGPRRRICVDLSSIVLIEPSAALYLAAEMDRWQRIVGKRLQPVTLSDWNPEVRRLLNAAGFFSLLGTSLPSHMKSGLNDSDIQWFRFTSRTLTEGKALKALRGRMEASFGEVGRLRRQLYGPLIEAIKNAVEHAYPEKTLSAVEAQRIGPRWWLMGAVDRKRRIVSVTVLDLGVSIPFSLPTSAIWPIIGRLIRSGIDSDELLLQSAFEYGRSRTARPERGKGLPQILELIDGHPDNHIRVYSRKGFYEAYGKTTGTAYLKATALPGTLINWEIAIPSNAQDA